MSSRLPLCLSPSLSLSLPLSLFLPLSPSLSLALPLSPNLSLSFSLPASLLYFVRTLARACTCAHGAAHMCGFAHVNCVCVCTSLAYYLRTAIYDLRSSQQVTAVNDGKRRRRGMDDNSKRIPARCTQIKSKDHPVTVETPD
eukprot:GHVU01152691.1.p1 GENE.GHVU01152691.1~~GHVU01152691.1.p1  ORF type:complete len:142 (+),score=9.65 GHVU01152691.1:182-607(+)